MLIWRLPTAGNSHSFKHCSREADNNVSICKHRSCKHWSYKLEFVLQIGILDVLVAGQLEISECSTPRAQVNDAFVALGSFATMLYDVAMISTCIISLRRGAKRSCDQKLFPHLSSNCTPKGKMKLRILSADTTYT